MVDKQDEFELRAIEMIRTKREKIAGLENECKGILETLDLYRHTRRNPINRLEPLAPTGLVPIGIRWRAKSDIAAPGPWEFSRDRNAVKDGNMFEVRTVWGEGDE